MSDTRTKIISAAVDLFSETGYAETSMRNIAEAVGIRPSSIYNHFESKDELLTVILKQYTDYLESNRVSVDELGDMEPRDAIVKMLTIFENDDSGRMKKILRIFMRTQYNEDISRDFMRNEMCIGTYRYIKSVLDRLRELNKIGEIQTDMYARLFVAQIIASSMVEMHFRENESLQMPPGTPDDEIEFLIDQIVGA